MRVSSSYPGRTARKNLGDRLSGRGVLRTVPAQIITVLARNTSVLAQITTVLLQITTVPAQITSELDRLSAGGFRAELALGGPGENLLRR